MKTIGKLQYNHVEPAFWSIHGPVIKGEKATYAIRYSNMDDIRNIEQAMGGYDKKVQNSELPIFKKLSKSIVSATDISKGESITLDKITTKGPGTGISPMKIDELIGKTANVNIPADTVILEENIDW